MIFSKNRIFWKKGQKSSWRFQTSSKYFLRENKMKKRKSDDAAKCYELNKKKKQAAVWATVFTSFVESICTDEDNSIRAEERKFSRLCWKSHVSFLTPKEFKRVYGT
jgi:hypothetical protein